MTWQVPGYRVDELLGVGSSGQVWRAVDLATGEAVALKRIRGTPGVSAGAVTEAAILAALDHPHLLRLHAVEHVGDELVLVLDLAAGGALSTLLARRGRITVGEVITAIAPVAAAVAYAHSVGIVHGDVSAANILFTAAGRPLLADLGMARLLGTSGPVLTTPDYADPAVAAGGPLTAASDVFMLAAVALHALTGAAPWSGPDARSVFLQAASASSAAGFGARLAAAGVPDPVRAVVERGLAPVPDDRGTAAEFALDLRHAAEPAAVELTAGRPAPSVTSRSTGDRVGSWPLELPPSEAPPSEAHGCDASDAGQDGASEHGDVRDGDVRDGAPVPFGAARLTSDPVRFSGGSDRALPLGSSGRHLARPPGRRGPHRLRLMLAATAALVVGLALWQCWPAGAPSSSAAAPRHRPVGVPTASAAPVRPTSARPPRTTAPATTPPPATTGPPAAMPSTSSATSTPPSEARTGPPGAAALGADPLAALRRLDELRSAAFARRDVSLLARVYASPGLLARDRALLLAIVPAGCGLRGVHTRFSAVTVTARSAHRVIVRARGRVGPSALVCGGTARAAAPGSAPETLRITLLPGPGGVRIARLATTSG